MRNSLLEVTPVIPGSLSRLPELAGNLFFSWHRPTRALFEDLDPELWKQTNGNPRLMLRCVSQERARARRARTPTYLARYQQALETLDAYMRATPATAEEPLVAYFCAEYGFHESFPIYSGGLGVLAGDYCKAASDERAQFRRGRTAVRAGLLHPDRRQRRRAARASTCERDPRDLPVEPVRNADGEWLQGAACASPARDVRRAPVEGAGGPRRGVPARHQLHRERRRRPRHHAPPVRRR